MTSGEYDKSGGEDLVGAIRELRMEMVSALIFTEVNRGLIRKFDLTMVAIEHEKKRRRQCSQNGWRDGGDDMTKKRGWGESGYTYLENRYAKHRVCFQKEE